ncbi:hypothetical protein P5P86_11650 [Nocardioides sp. BP30]|uniref:hypothetical protein n=1 Tax=Nocardioides sp. BP30 TaxID=3036374 RepID=UPI002468B45B|nr:hypothetical protein [Nocardioides sp. BP30]WGL50618.1 hypothetical protein P5P86_11650 [Nocardioides sp. BP30]
MTYTPQKPPIAENSDALRARIPGWGADLDPADRPSVPRERFDPTFSGAHWEYPEQQPEKWPRERSVEHTQLPPVFGTSCPPKGLSGAIRRFAYAKYSEGQAAHWLLLIAGDRVDALESGLVSLLTLRPDNPITETGIVAEVTRHGLRSRLGHGRADVKHQWMDPLIVGAPWIGGGAAAYLLVRRMRRRS